MVIRTSGLIKYDIWNYEDTAVKMLNKNFDYVKVILMGYESEPEDGGKIHIMFKGLLLCRLLYLTGNLIHESGHEMNFNIITVSSYREFLRVHESIKKFYKNLDFHYNIDQKNCTYLEFNEKITKLFV